MARFFPSLLALAATAAPAAPLEIRVTNVRNATGTVHVDICPEAKFLKDGCPWSAEAPATAGTTVVTIADLPPGHYAAQAFHDENRNRKADRNLIGIPTEGVGFSNDAPIRLAPPKFADAAFDQGPAAQAITFRMRYFSGPSGPTAR